MQNVLAGDDDSLTNTLISILYLKQFENNIAPKLKLLD